MIPRIHGKVGQAIGGKYIGKWFFTLWLTSLGGREGESLGTFGPWDSEEIAQTELRKVSRFLVEQLEKAMNGSVSGKVIDMKTNKVSDWSEI
jgi:hypothetical protein